MRSFVSVPGVLTRADPAEVCLRPGTSPPHGEPRLETWVREETGPYLHT